MLRFLLGFSFSTLPYKEILCVVVFVWLHEMFIERSAVHPHLPGHTNTLWRTVSSILSAEVALGFLTGCHPVTWKCFLSPTAMGILGLTQSSEGSHMCKALSAAYVMFLYCIFSGST